MRRTVSPAAEIAAQIDQLLAVGVGDARWRSTNLLERSLSEVNGAPK